MDQSTAIDDDEAATSFVDPTEKITVSNEKQQSAMILPKPQNDVISTLPAQLGLDFLTDPPSLPEKTVRLHLSGKMKFSTVLNCHAYIVHDAVVVLVADKRIKSDIIDISLDDPEIQTELILDDGSKIAIYPPIPGILTYDIGVLRHFVFVRIKPADVE